MEEKWAVNHFSMITDNKLKMQFAFVLSRIINFEIYKLKCIIFVQSPEPSAQIGRVIEEGRWWVNSCNHSDLPILEHGVRWIWRGTLKYLRKMKGYSVTPRPPSIRALPAPDSWTTSPESWTNLHRCANKKFIFFYTFFITVWRNRIRN